MWQQHVLWITTTLTMMIYGQTASSDSIPIYLATKYCNVTLDLDQTEIGFFRWITFLHIANENQHVCHITLRTPPGRYIGVQILEYEQTSFCVPYLYITRTYCTYNITFRKEISSRYSANESGMQVSFHGSMLDSNPVNETRPWTISLLFYIYSETKQTPFGAVCFHDYTKCAKSKRCIPENNIQFDRLYNLCQTLAAVDTNIETGDTEGNTDNDGLTGYSAVITLGMLVLVISILICINYCSKRNCCGLRFGTASVPVNDRHSTSSSGTSRHRPVFSLSDAGIPPPNYSDLSFQDQGASRATSASSDTSVITSDTAASSIPHVAFRISTDSSIGRVTDTLPPTYSDAVINEVKYHVHTL